MLPDGLYYKGIPGLDEAILAEDYCVISGKNLEQVIYGIKVRQLLGAFHRGVWYVEAPPFCEEKLRVLDFVKREERARKHQDQRQSENQQPQKDSEEDLEKKYGRILQLKGTITLEDLKQRWKELSKQYHPDNVHHLGPKLRVVAEQEMKAINEAYQYFKCKYGV